MKYKYSLVSKHSVDPIDSFDEDFDLNLQKGDTVTSQKTNDSHTSNVEVHYQVTKVEKSIFIYSERGKTFRTIFVTVWCIEVKNFL